MLASSRYFVILFVCLAARSFSLPLGFGTPPAGSQYDELKSRHFYLYHDRRTPHEARSILNSLEQAQPILQHWLGESRSSPLPVIMSAATDQASFANFITDALEIQTLGQAPRDLAWHEFVHENMYRHFLNLLGPAGSIIHLIWLPSWYVEGLAEALSVSIGSDQQQSVERYHALTGRWPSFAKLHALYGGTSFGYRGYATSGSFVSYLLKRYQANDLGNFLRDYSYKSMPWYWPYGLIPLKNSMPFDRSLKQAYGKNSHEMYLEYQTNQGNYWRSRAKANPKNWFVQPPTGDQFDWTTESYRMRVVGDSVTTLKRSAKHEQAQISEFQFNSQDWANAVKPLESLPYSIHTTVLTPGNEAEYALEKSKTERGVVSYILRRFPAGLARTIALSTVVTERPGYAAQLLQSQSHLIWQEQDTETTRICQMPLDQASESSIDCSLTAVHPKNIAIVGWQYYPNTSSTPSRLMHLWVRETEQGIAGDRHTLIRLTPDLNTSRTFPVSFAGRPEAITQGAVGSVWVMFAGSQNRPILNLDEHSLQCLGQIDNDNLFFDLQAKSNGELVASVFNGDEIALFKFDPLKLAQYQSSCSYVPLSDGHTSPLVTALKNPGAKPMDLAVALKPSSTTTDEKSFTSLTNANRLETQIDKESKPAAWRARPILAVPWLGSDSDGMQLGVLSVPLMDHMQNEDVRAYFGYGLYSHFPNTEITLTSTRFWPNLELGVYRYQTWDGSHFEFEDKSRANISRADADAQGLKAEDGHYSYSYLDEKGVRLGSSLFLHDSRIRVGAGIKSSELKSYIGIPDQRAGHLNETNLSISKNADWHGLLGFAQLTTDFTPEFMNDAYSYQKFGSALGLSYDFDFLDSITSWSAEFARTFGERRRDLQEYYRPLRVYVPGSKVGLNYLNFPLYGSGSLFRAQYGDTSAALRGNYHFPLIKNIDRLVRIFYWESLSFTAAGSYGGAWNSPRDSSDKPLMAAHAYSVDAHFDIKGVNFKLGGGTGQVFGNWWDVFAAFSFDAVF